MSIYLRVFDPGGLRGSPPSTILTYKTVRQSCQNSSSTSYPQNQFIPHQGNPSSPSRSLFPPPYLILHAVKCHATNNGPEPNGTCKPIGAIKVPPTILKKSSLRAKLSQSVYGFHQKRRSLGRQLPLPAPAEKKRHRRWCQLSSTITHSYSTAE